MSPVAEAAPANDAMAVAWTNVAPVPPARHRSRLAQLAMQLALGGTAAAIFWLTGHRTAALAVAVVVIVMGVACALSERVARAFQWLVGRVSEGAGVVLGFVLLGFVDLFVFTPASLVLRLIRQDPLGHGASPRDASFWHAPDGLGRRSLHRHQYTYETPARSVGTKRTATARLRGLAGAVVLLLLCDIAVGAGVNAVLGSDEPKTNPFLGAHAAEIAAAPKTPWWPAVSAETFQFAASARPAPLRGWAFPTFNGKYVHTTDGVRRSYEPAAAQSGNAVDVAFFGGSTMFGAYQRDEYTIASDVARRAEADGVPIRVVNHGQPAYSIWQELQLLQESLAKGERPDVVVFYDGINELFSQATSGPTNEPTHMKAKEYADAIKSSGVTHERSLASQAYDSYADVSVVLRVLDRFTPFVPDHKTSTEAGTAGFAADQSAKTSLVRAKDAVALHARAVQIIQHLATAYHFRAQFFWQPMLYTKRVAPGEAAVAGSWQETPSAWRVMANEARRSVRPPVVNLSGALDQVKQPVMLDFMHTNEQGAQVVGNAIYANLRPILDQAMRGSR